MRPAAVERMAKAGELVICIGRHVVFTSTLEIDLTWARLTVVIDEKNAVGVEKYSSGIE
jgi:hypothetical protein